MAKSFYLNPKFAKRKGERACILRTGQDKRKYNKEKVEDIAAKMSAKFNKNMVAYQCDHCGSYHIGTFRGTASEIST